MKNERLNASPVPKGILLIVGGHENKDAQPDDKAQPSEQRPREILEAFVKLTGKDKPVIEVVTTAGSEPEESFNDYQKAFAEIGVEQIGHIHHNKRGDVTSDNAVERIAIADAIYFSGGDQLKLTSIYGGTEFLFKLKQRYIHEQIVLGGTSAGAMAFSTPMIFAGNKEVQQIAGEVRITTGLEFLKDVCIDTHFVDRSRFVRMAQVIATNPTCIGIGLEEDTAIIVRNGTETEVIGSGVVLIVDGFGITDSNIVDFGMGKRIFIQDLNVKLLAKGSSYTLPKNNPPHI